MKFGCWIGIFLNSANLIFRSTDISQCFRGSLRLRDNESRLYYHVEQMLRNLGYKIKAVNCDILYLYSNRTGNEIDHYFLKGGFLEF